MSNISFVVFIDSGEIVQHGHCPEESLSLQGSQGRSVMAGDGDFDKFYVINNTITPYTDAELQSKNNLPDGFVWQMPQRIAVDKRALLDAQKQAWERMKTIRSTKESSPFTCNGLVYDANKINITGGVQMASIAKSSGAAFSVNWTLADNTIKVLDADGMIAVGVTLGSLVDSIYDTASNLRTNIYNTKTIADADAIVWPT